MKLNFPEPPKSYESVFLQETDKPLPEKINPATRYAFFSEIAAGGKSIIKSCKDLHLSRYVCYKALKPEFSKDVVEQQRLIREARVTAMLQHPNTVPTYELGRDNRGNVYFTMKLVHGYTFREILDYRELYDLTQLMNVLLEIAYALNYAHSHGVAHRDIKPENILVGPYNEVLLLDWGLAKVWNPDGTAVPDQVGKENNGDDLSITNVGKAQGTAHYMSPEQINQDPEIDTRTDIYSLGAVMYEALCGQTAARGDKLHEVIDSVLRQEPPPPSEVASWRVPAALERIAMTCLRREPDGRFATIGEVIRQLKGEWTGDLRPGR